VFKISRNRPAIHGAPQQMTDTLAIFHNTGATFANVDVSQYLLIGFNHEFIAQI
jgi:hypothetical protein